MTTEELLIPRWKVIADFPDSQYTIGDIYLEFKARASPIVPYQYFVSPTNNRHGVWDKPELYPAIFKKL